MLLTLDSEMTDKEKCRGSLGPVYKQPESEYEGKEGTIPREWRSWSYLIGERGFPTLVAEAKQSAMGCTNLGGHSND